MSTPRASQATLRERAHLLRVAITAANAAAAIIRARASGAAALEWRVKSPADFVSDVDTAAESAIRDCVTRDVPGATVIGEELSPEAAAGSAITFVVDPLDGTTNFLHGFPMYAVSIAVLCDGALVAGTIVDVAANEVYAATLGGGASRNDAPIRVSSTDDPARALIGTGFPFKNLDKLDAYQRQFAAVTRATAGIRRPGSAALDLANVASGRYDAFWELTLAPWDFSAGTLLVREAGGVVTDLDGQPPPIASSAIVAGNPAMHAWLLQLLNSDLENDRS